MFKDFQRVVNSSKWMPHRDYPETFDLSIADMDVGFLKEYFKYFVKDMEDKNNFTYKSQYQKYEQAIINWYKVRYHAEIQKDHIIASPSICNMLGCCLTTFTSTGDKILIMTPVYNFYQNAIRALKRQVVSSELVRVKNRYQINWKDFQQKLKNCKLLAFCNPHNPTGRIWNKSQTKRIVNLCQKYDVYIYSDEILCDLSFKNDYFYSLVNQDYNKIIVGNSISKAFNASSIQGGYGIIKDQKVREKYFSISYGAFKFLHNEFSLSLTPIFYGDYHQIWFILIEKLIKNNYEALQDFIKRKMPKLILLQLQSAYNIILDFKNYVRTEKELRDKFEINRIYPIYMTTYYYPARQTTDVRFSIAVSSQYFSKFLSKLHEVFVIAPKL